MRFLNNKSRLLLKPQAELNACDRQLAVRHYGYWTSCGRIATDIESIQLASDDSPQCCERISHEPISLAVDPSLQPRPCVCDLWPIHRFRTREIVGAPASDLFTGPPNLQFVRSANENGTGCLRTWPMRAESTKVLCPIFVVQQAARIEGSHGECLPVSFIFGPIYSLLTSSIRKDVSTFPYAFSTGRIIVACWNGISEQQPLAWFISVIERRRFCSRGECSAAATNRIVGIVGRL